MPLIAAGEHPDVYELDAASRTGVDNVREEIISRVSYAPVRGSYKIYIIDEVHMLTTAAFNALLKTLEEPPSHVVFVLCTTDPQKILETILSRVQRFDFHAISNDDMLARPCGTCAQPEGFRTTTERPRPHRAPRAGRHARRLTTLEQLAHTGQEQTCPRCLPRSQTSSIVVATCSSSRGSLPPASATSTSCAPTGSTRQLGCLGEERQACCARGCAVWLRRPRRPACSRC